MHKVDGSGNVSGLFTEGNPTTAQLATAITADWLNAVQTELVNVILAAGLTLNKADNTQVMQALTILSQGRLNTPFKPTASSPANMQIKIGEGFVFKPPTLLSVAQQTTANFTAPGANARIDRVVINMATGAYAVVAGAASATPIAPAIPAGYLPVAQVVLIAGQTSILQSDIVDERAIWALGLGQAAFADANGNITVVNGSLVAKGVVPVGGEISYPCVSLPDPLSGEGTWFWSEGAALLRTAYPAAFARISTMHGKGNNSTQAATELYFCLPNRPGYGLRHVDGGRGIDPDAASRTEMQPGGNTGDAIGTVQGDQLKAHSHLLVRSTSDSQDSLNANNAVSQANNPSNQGYDQKYRMTGVNGAEANIGKSALTGGAETRMKNQSTRFAIRVA